MPLGPQCFKDYLIDELTGSAFCDKAVNSLRNPFIPINQEAGSWIRR